MNPEFQRNLWLEASPSRLSWAGVVLLVIYGAAALLGGQGDGGDIWRALGVAGAVVFLGAALVWGPRVAGRAVMQEVAERTWDFQRLSALTPWAMTWGKLFGATSLVWIATGSSLAVVAAAQIARGEIRAAFISLFSGAALALLVQAGSMALALAGVRRARAEGRPPTMRFGFGGIVGLLVLASALGRVLPTRGLGRGGGGFGQPFGSGDIVWWGVHAPRDVFILLSLAVFAKWALVGAWRLMRLELQMQNRPWGFAGFTLFLGLYAAGFDYGSAAMRFAAAGAVFAVCAYAAAFAEPADRVRLWRFAQSLRTRATDAALLTAPVLIAPVALAILAAVGVVASAGGGVWRLSGPFALAALAFLLRDLGVIAFFRFGPRPGRGDFGAVLGLFLLYVIGGLVGGVLGGSAMSAVFTPSPAAPGVSLAAGAVQAVLAWVLAYARIREPERSVAAA